MTLGTPSADTGRLIRAAMRGLREVWRPGERFQKAGVLFPELMKADGIQGDLLSEPDSPKSLALMRALDQLNTRYGRGTIRHPQLGFHHDGPVRPTLLTPPTTTRWAELLRVP